jgi:predicted kinase
MGTMKTPDRTWGRYVVVSGPAASGKTVLAQAASEELGWPLISKDEIKEALAGVLPPKTTDDAASLGRAAMAVLLRIAAETTSGAVLDAVWREGQGRLELGELPGEIVELFCQCPPAVVKERYESRTRPAQYIPEHATAESLWSTETFAPVSGGWHVIEVDATSHPDVEALADRISDAFRHQSRRGSS